MYQYAQKVLWVYARMYASKPLLLSVNGHFKVKPQSEIMIHWAETVELHEVPEAR